MTLDDDTMSTLDDYMADLIPVSEWPWALFRITWWARDKTQSKVLWLVDTQDSMWDSVQDRWPSDYWMSFDYEMIQRCKEPTRLPSRNGVLHVDCWEHGLKLATQLKLV